MALPDGPNGNVCCERHGGAGICGDCVYAAGRGQGRDWHTLIATSWKVEQETEEEEEEEVEEEEEEEEAEANVVRYILSERPKK